MALVVRPFTYVNGNIIDADENNPNEDTLYNLVNGALDDANIAVGADIQFAKLEDCQQDFILVGDVTNKAAPSATLPGPVVATISHSALADLTVPADHPWATLVDGTRAFTGDQSMGNNQLTNVGAPGAGGDATNMTYVDGAVSALSAAAVLRDGSQAFTGAQSMGGFALTNVLNPVAAQDAATKDYVDTTIAADYVTIATNQVISGDKTLSGAWDTLNGSVFSYNGPDSLYAPQQTLPGGATADRSVTAQSLGKLWLNMSCPGGAGALTINDDYNVTGVAYYNAGAGASSGVRITIDANFANTNYVVSYHMNVAIGGATPGELRIDSQAVGTLDLTVVDPATGNPIAIFPQCVLHVTIHGEVA